MKTSGFLVADGSANNQHLHMLFKNYPFKKIIDFRERKREERREGENQRLAILLIHASIG